MNGEEVKLNESNVNVGDVFLVNGPNNIKVSAAILDIRASDIKGKFEYYMHYKNCDHRLDNWISIDQIDLAAGPQPAFDEISEKRDVVKALSDERLTRLQKRKICGNVQVIEPFNPNMESLNIKALKPQVKSIDSIQFGKYEIECWYVSPYPEDYGNVPKLWICQYCLKYMKYQNTYLNHKSICLERQPPGFEIYRKGHLSVYEVDGNVDTLYCQNLCLMSKLFLHHKAVYFDVEPFLFYVLTYVNKEGAHLLGYFSKEKESLDGNNLACLLVLPPFQKCGFGNFLISLSYELSKIEGSIGTPEKPLSDLGLATYQTYWSWVLLNAIKICGENVSIKELSKLTAISQEDILSTLKSMNMARYWKCKHVVCVTTKQLDEALKTEKFSKAKNLLDPVRLMWVPKKPKHHHSHQSNTASSMDKSCYTHHRTSSNSSVHTINSLI